MFNRSRMIKRHIGKNAESVAKTYLQKQGLAFKAENYHCRQGEIDLIMVEDKTLVFVEVKFRYNHHYGSGFEVVTPKKQQRIIKTAHYYLYQHQLTNSVNCRFDVVSISPARYTADDFDKNTINLKDVKVNWLKNAFCSE